MSTINPCSCGCSSVTIVREQTQSLEYNASDNTFTTSGFISSRVDRIECSDCFEDRSDITWAIFPCQIFTPNNLPKMMDDKGSEVNLLDSNCWNN